MVRDPTALLDVEVGDDHGRTMARKCLDDASADALGTAGDDCDPSHEVAGDRGFGGLGVNAHRQLLSRSERGDQTRSCEPILNALLSNRQDWLHTSARYVWPPRLDGTMLARVLPNAGTRFLSIQRGRMRLLPLDSSGSCVVIMNS